MNKLLRWTLITVVAFVLGTFLIRGLGHSYNAAPDAADGDAVHASSGAVDHNGTAVVTLGASAEKQAEIKLVTLRKARNRQEVTAPAMVLAVQDLATLRSQYAADQNRVKKARIAVGVDRKEYQRLKTLYAQNQNASAKALQAAQGRLLSDRADLATARQQLELERAAVRQSWGGVVAEWVASDSPSLKRVLGQRDVLVEVTILAGQKHIQPRTVLLEIPAGGFVEAELVSPFPRVDPRIQGVSLLYLAPARPGLVPGVNPVARFAAGRFESGVVVPSSAVVWWQGNAWVYQETAPGHFSRREVSTGTPADDGFFVTAGLVPGDRIVAGGAETLLSEEFRSEIRPED